MDRQDREVSDRPTRPAEQEQLAARLDRLTAQQADEVMRRAISLSDDEAGILDAGGFDAETLRTVAAELGIPAKHLERALAEQQAGLLEPTPGPTATDRLLGLTGLEQSTIIAGDRADVERSVAVWLSRHEGLRIVRRSPNGAIWEKDTRPLASIRVGLGLTQGSKSLREVGTVEHSVRSLGDDEHLVAIRADSGRLRTVAGVMSALAVTLALTGGVVVAAGTGSVLAGIATVAVTAAALGSAVVGGIRGWANRIRRAGERAIDAVRHPAASRFQEPVSGWLGSVLRGLGLTSGSRPRDPP